MKVIVSARAERDVIEILDGLARDNAAAATDLNAQFNQRLTQLTRLPRMGRLRSDIDDGLRGLLVRPYVLFYRIENDDILVVRVLHGSRDLRQALNDDR